MHNSDDAQWILEVLETLRSPEASLVRELLQHMRELRQDQEQEALLALVPASVQQERPTPDGTHPQNTELLRRRAAVESRLRQAWGQVRNLPPCLRQAQILKETCFGGAGSIMLMDPIQDGQVRLTMDQAREYGDRALEIAENLGDLGEVSEICYALAHHCHLRGEFGEALEYSEKGLDLATKVGNLYYQSLALRVRGEVLSLTEADLVERIRWTRRLVEVRRKQGDVTGWLASLGLLGQLLLTAGDDEEASQVLADLRALMDRVPRPLHQDTAAFAHYYHALHAIMLSHQGHGEEALEDLKEAISGNARNPACREDLLWYDLAWFEMLCARHQRQTEFRAFCQQMKSTVQLPGLSQWYLVPDIPAPIDWDHEGHLGQGLPPGWRWTDPLGKSSYKVDGGLEVTPTMGVGVYRNVYAPRWTQSVQGDFAIETVLDYSDGMTRAGGILAYRDDKALIRLAAGIQFDGEVTLTVKSPTRQMAIVARGLLEAPCLHLRLERTGNCFAGWCSDGTDWYKCGEAETPVGRTLEVGLYAECTYRMLAPRRCTATPVKFTELRLGRRCI
jgi:tetratricopeptide (TPR) repeat protein